MSLFQLRQSLTIFFSVFFLGICATSQGTRLLRQPSLSADHIAFSYAGDIWISDHDGGNVKRITSTQAIESRPHISPNGELIAFTSSRSGYSAVYVVSIMGGTPTQLTWHPSGALVCDWSPDGSKILFASRRDSAPSGHNYLWTISKDGGPPTRLTAQWGHDAEFATDGHRLILDRMSRWDSEWRMYRGGQNTPLIILDTRDNSEILINNNRSTDIQPVWLGDEIYFISDRDGNADIWKFTSVNEALSQVTSFTGSDVKTLSGHGTKLCYERDGLIHLYDLSTNTSTQLQIDIVGDFPWAETKWEDVTQRVGSVSLSPTGKRIVLEARGEIFTVPVKDGAARNLTSSSDAADRRPIWSPKGDQIAWFSDNGGEGYALYLGDQTGMKELVKIDIGESKLGWEPVWSPDGSYIAFVDDDTRVKIVTMEDHSIKTIDNAGNNLERGNMNLTWSPDSKWLAYSKSGGNMLRGIMVWHVEQEEPKQLTDKFADAVQPAWDRDGKHFYFLASTDVALGSGWANTSSMQADPEYAAYVINLTSEDASPFEPKSDEEEVEEEIEEEPEMKAEEDKKKKKKGKDKNDESKEKDEDGDKDGNDEMKVEIDFENIVRRTIALPMPEASYYDVIAGPEGTVFIGEAKSGSRSGLTYHKFSLKDREAKEFASGVRNLAISNDGQKLVGQVGGQWKIMEAGSPSGNEGKPVKVQLKMKLDRVAEWAQMFEEAWRYERDYFYDKDMHGRDWDEVHDRYAPLLPYIRHRADLTYILDQVNGELSVGHSFVFGGDYPETEDANVGLIGADLIPENSQWKIKRIYTTEAWNPGLSGPLDRPGTKIKEGYYLVGVNGRMLTANDNPFEFFDGTAGQQTIVHINDKPSFEDSWQETIEPVRSENGLRRRAWVEDNRRMVDSLSGGKLAYVWVPNTGGPGFVSFNRYYFAQQDKMGAVIDERYNGGGLLDDYMVDLMTRRIRAALTNEVPNGRAMRLPAGILGPKVLLINELAGSGGDFFPWVFRQQNAGPLVGTTTWGGLVKSSVHYGLIDGGALTAPDNAVFDPVNNQWVAENKGVAPDIEVRQDARSLSQGRDAQLERAVQELLKLVEEEGVLNVVYPDYSEPTKGN